MEVFLLELNGLHYFDVSGRLYCGLSQLRNEAISNIQFRNASVALGKPFSQIQVYSVGFGNFAKKL